MKASHNKNFWITKEAFRWEKKQMCWERIFTHCSSILFFQTYREANITTNNLIRNRKFMTFLLRRHPTDKKGIKKYLILLVIWRWGLKAQWEVSSCHLEWLFPRKQKNNNNNKMMARRWGIWTLAFIGHSTEIPQNPQTPPTCFCNTSARHIPKRDEIIRKWYMHSHVYCSWHTKSTNVSMVRKTEKKICTLSYIGR